MDELNPTRAALELQPEPEVRQSGKSKRYARKHFRRGKWVEVLSEAEIRATLDQEGKLDGLSFMPEQVEYCGRRFRIFRRADRVYLDHHYFVVQLKDTVLLDDLRCNGSAHGGCQMRCLMFWKEAWLRPVKSPKKTETLPRTDNASVKTIDVSSFSAMPAARNELRPAGDEKYTCQATELACIGTLLSGWDPRPYFWDIYYRERGVGEVLRLMFKQAKDKLVRLTARFQKPKPLGKSSKPLELPLNLQPGDWVEVKSYGEIRETLSDDSRLRGLGFSPDMIPFCGKRFQVSSRVERIILEWTGELKTLNDTVALDTVHCDGSSCRACPRNCFFLWREDWLKRVEKNDEIADEQMT